MNEKHLPNSRLQVFGLQVFVYGTLKRGHQRNGVLAKQTLIGEATTAADYRMYDLGDYPGLVEVARGSGVQVQGEVYRVDQQCLRQLDQIEGVDQGLYQRCEIRLSPPLENSDSTMAYFYLADISDCNDCGVSW